MSRDATRIEITIAGRLDKPSVAKGLAEAILRLHPRTDEAGDELDGHDAAEAIVTAADTRKPLRLLLEERDERALTMLTTVCRVGRLDFRQTETVRMTDGPVVAQAVTAYNREQDYLVDGLADDAGDTLVSVASLRRWLEWNRKGYSTTATQALDALEGHLHDMEVQAGLHAATALELDADARAELDAVVLEQCELNDRPVPARLAATGPIPR